MGAVDLFLDLAMLGVYVAAPATVLALLPIPLMWRYTARIIAIVAWWAVVVPLSCATGAKVAEILVHQCCIGG